MAWPTQIQAEAIVKDRSQYLKAPALTTTDITNCVLQTAHATVWVAATAYKYGDKVVPTARNGYYFVCMTPGTSGAVEPVWPTLSGSWWSVPNRGWYPPYSLSPWVGGITDGTVAWQAMTPDWESPWDLDAATYRAWMLKAALASELYSVSEDGQNASRNQIYDHCIAMSQKYAPVGIA